MTESNNSETEFQNTGKDRVDTEEAMVPAIAEPSTSYTWIIYTLYGLGFFVGFTWIAGVIMAYVTRDDVKGTYLDSHASWQIRTFWWTLVWTVISIPFIVFFVGFVFLAIVYIWSIYRVVYGAVRLSKYRPV